MKVLWLNAKVGIDGSFGRAERVDGYFEKIKVY